MFVSKLGKYLHIPVSLYKIVVQGGILFMDIFPDTAEESHNHNIIGFMLHVTMK